MRGLGPRRSPSVISLLAPWKSIAPDGRRGHRLSNLSVGRSNASRHTKLLGELGRHFLGLKQRRVLALDAFVGCLHRPTSNGLPVDIRSASARRARITCVGSALRGRPVRRSFSGGGSLGGGGSNVYWPKSTMRRASFDPPRRATRGGRYRFARKRRAETRAERDLMARRRAWASQTTTPVVV